MINFLKKRSYDIVVMYITQIAISIFGLALAFAVPTGQSALSIAASVIAVLFYLFLIYTKTWELGYKDSNAFKRGDKSLSRFEGLYMGLTASAINLILAILITLGWLLDNGAIDSIAGVAVTISLLTEGMYTGILSATVNGVTLNSVGFMYFIITIPLIVTSFLAYYAGSHDFKVFGGAKKSK